MFNHPEITELNSAFTQSEAKRQIICPPDLRVTPKEFYDAFVARLAHNRLPARATLQKVSWDHGQRPQEMILIAFTGDESPADVVRLVVGFKQMGNFIYVERMLTFLPPVLPSVREKRELLQQKVVNSDLFSDLGCGALGVAGALLLGLGFLAAQFDAGGGTAMLCFVPGVIAFMFMFGMVSSSGSDKAKAEKENADIAVKNQDIASWNQQAEQEQKQFTLVIERWSKKVGQFFYLSQVDDVFGRWIGAVSLTLDQVIKQMFVDRQAQAEAWEIQQKTQKEIEQQMQKLQRGAMQ